MGSAARQGGVPQGGEGRAWRRPRGCADAVRRVLRRSLSRRVPRSDPQRHRRSRVRKRARAAQPLPDRRFRYRASMRCATTQARGRHPQREGVPRHHPRAERRGAGGTGRQGRRRDRRRRSVRRRVPGRLARGADHANCGTTWRAGGRRSDPAHGRAAGNVAQGRWPKRRDLPSKHLRSRRFQQLSTSVHRYLGAFRYRRGTVALGWHYRPESGERVSQEGSHEFCCTFVCRASTQPVPGRYPICHRGPGGRIQLRYLEFPDGRQVVLPTEAGDAAEFAPTSFCRPKIIWAIGNGPAASRI